MTKQQITALFSWLPPVNQPQTNSGHSMLFMIEDAGMADRIYEMLTAANVSFITEQADDLCYEIEVQTED